MSPLCRESVRSGSCQMRVLKRTLLGIATAITVATFAACDTPGVTLIDPDLSDDDDRSLTITVQLEDTTLARTLGWSRGVPSADVYLMRVGDEFDPITIVTDSTGTAVLETVLPGLYRMAAYRMLGEEETGPTDGAIRAFGDGRVAQVAAGRTIPMTLLADQPSSLVFSEVQLVGRYDGTNWAEYDWFVYFELHNNTDSTIYLDGMLYGHAWKTARDYGTFPCVVTEPFRMDPIGLWSNWLHRFPGSGADYPVAPGQTVVVALDAVDHSVVHPNLPDLTQADFELQGHGDADNPDVPNLPEVGPDIYWYSHGVGPTPTAPMFLAKALDLDALAQMIDPFWAHPWVRIPREAVLDVVDFDGMSPDVDALIAPPCDWSVHPSLNRLEAVHVLNLYDATFTAQRRVLQRRDGRFVLQDVNTSFVDFLEAKRNPGSIGNLRVSVQRDR